MFPFQPNDQHDLGFGNPTTSQTQRYQIHDDLIMDDDFSVNNLINFSIGSNQSKRKDLELCGKESSHGCSSKNVKHREVERKRRHQISNLYASLSSLLPHHHIEGKRSVCDQIEVAESHIKRMEKNIQELETRRNKLKSPLLNYSSGGNVESSNERDNNNNNVTINVTSDGLMEILISQSSTERSNLGLSRVFAELQPSEIDVISSVSTRIKDRFVHKIQVKAVDMANPGALVLQERLLKAIM